jgi:D-threo-aldose 1-dehydrogenase
MTELGLGVAQFGNLYRETTVEQVEGAIDAAWSAGIRYFDTAPHYGLGLSERRLGAQLAARPRDEFIVSTKVGKLLVPSPETAHLKDDDLFDVPADQRRVFDYSRDGILRSFEASLTRLGLDRIDILYLHDPDEHWESASTTGIDTLIELRDEGVVRSVGAGMNQSAMLTEFIRRADVDMMMVAGRYTLLDHTALDDLLPLALERGVGIVAAGVYNSGLLGQSRPDSTAKFNYESASPEPVARANAIADICENHGVSLPDVAIAFPLRHPAVVSVVLGARDRAQVESNVARFERVIPAALWVDLENAGYLNEPTR